MKRLRVDETTKEGSGPPLTSSLYRQPLPNTAPAISYSGAGTLKVVGEGMQSSIYPPPPPATYGVMPAAAAPHSGKPQAMQPLNVGSHAQIRAQGASPPSAPPQEPQPQQQQQSPGNNFQRLKVEDALSYLDLVKFKFGTKPQVYNDFLDIMKEFKSQSIDTPGVIQRVSSLFKGFPDLIVGFNTFLPPGYKIEVQRSDRGYDFQVSVSMPSPTGTMQSDPTHQKSAMIFKGSGTINMMGTGQPTGLPPAQPLSLAPQVPPVAPQAPPVATTYHPSTYGNSAPIHNNSTHGALTLSAAAVSQALQGHTDAPQNQPVEFNHAINYVNKIKNRFQGQPEKYKRFLEILHTYQKEQRTLKESSQGQGGGGKHLTEQEVYSQVAKLFEHQSDLLAEFGQFLPDATNHITPPPLSEHVPSVVKKPPVRQPYKDHIMDRHVTHKPGHISGQVKRSPPYQGLMHRDVAPPKKHKLSSSLRDVTLAEAGKYGNLNDYAFFDKVRKAVRSQEVYNNFLRCLTLFNQEIISKSELAQLINPFLSKYPELMRWFREFLGQGEVEAIPFNVARVERPQGEHAPELDLSTAKRLGASYCVIPPAQEGMRCSGRTQLCREVLNDQWVSFPTWSEDSTFVSSRKTQYEEYMYRCEDERFELDVVIETNASTIRVLEGVQKKMSRMNPDEVARFHLDECLGGSSPVLHQRALRRIYGDKAQDMIDGLKRNPFVAVPVVLRRLKAKEEEWREAQKGFNKVWREQNEKYYLKSLDHQGINFKQNDVKALRSKSLFNEIETLFDERHEQNEEGSSEPMVGPHLVFHYKDRTILDDATNLLMHHVKRQTGVQKGEKRRIKQILCHFVPDLFFHPRQQLSDDEREDDDEKEEGDESPKSNSSSGDSCKGKVNSNPGKSPVRTADESVEVKSEPMDVQEDDVKVPLHAQCGQSDEAYTLFMANNNWYIFLRLHAILCERLARIYERTIALAAEETKMRTTRKESTAVALRLKPKPQIEVENYYTAFLEMVKNLLDGNMEPNAYEDTLREMFGIHAYIAFTLDKVVQYAVRQLQHCVTERTAIACTKLFHKEQKNNATGGPCTTAHRRVHQEMAYQRAAEKAVQDENCFKIFIYKHDCRMTMELLDTESEDPKKIDDAKKWSVYKERYADVTNADGKRRSPVYLDRNLRSNKRAAFRTKSKDREDAGDEDAKEVSEQNKGNTGRSDGEKTETPLEELERKLNERSSPERSRTEHVGYDVSDETQCKFNSADSKIMFTVNKNSYLYKHCAFSRAKQTHPSVTKRLATRFRSWHKRWTTTNISDVQHKQCTDWLMGRGDGVVPNRTRVLTDNDLSRTPYAPYNRYRVERLSNSECA